MILFCYGTRPEWVKIKPLIKIFKEKKYPFKLLFTGQHTDLIKDNDLINIDFKLDIKLFNNSRLDNIALSCLNIDNNIFENIDYVLVQGDTSSALFIALNAFHKKIKIIHLEAGLRTYDYNNPFPEEMNRRLIDNISYIHLCPTNLNYDNLITELITSEDFDGHNLGRAYICGNTVLDNLIDYKNKCEYSNIILIEMHRRENEEFFEKYFIEIEKLANKYKNLEFIFPMHLNPIVQKYKNIFKKVKIVEPLEYNSFLNYLIKCKLVITDSGGLQEECSFLNKKCIVCRKITERPESLNKSSFLCDDPNKLFNLFEYHRFNFAINFDCPFGDGNSAEKIYKILKDIC